MVERAGVDNQDDVLIELRVEMAVMTQWPKVLIALATVKPKP